MRTIILIAIVFALQEPYPGHDSHQAPPPGWFCQHQYYVDGKPQVEPSHVCMCDRKCMENADGEPYTVEDPKCTVYCHKDHCDCPTPCQDSD